MAACTLAWALACALASFSAIFSAALAALFASFDWADSLAAMAALAAAALACEFSSSAASLPTKRAYTNAASSAVSNRLPHTREGRSSHMRGAFEGAKGEDSSGTYAPKIIGGAASRTSLFAGKKVDAFLPSNVLVGVAVFVITSVDHEG